MGFLGPSREETHAATARGIEPYGFVTDPSRASSRQSYLPLAELPRPDRFLAADMKRRGRRPRQGFARSSGNHFFSVDSAKKVP